MITPAYARTMAAYNAEMNRRLYGAATRLSDAERRKDRGAFWGSIHGSLAHLLWADRAWMARFDGWDPPTRPLAESGMGFDDFAAMTEERTNDDAQIITWASQLKDTWLAEDLTWFSSSAGREMTLPRAILVMHFFNHQTHHRGQAHALLTAAGEHTGGTDLPFVLPRDDVGAQP